MPSYFPSSRTVIYCRQTPNNFPHRERNPILNRLDSQHKQLSYLELGEAKEKRGEKGGGEGKELSGIEISGRNQRHSSGKEPFACKASEQQVEYGGSVTLTVQEYTSGEEAIKVRHSSTPFHFGGTASQTYLFKKGFERGGKNKKDTIRISY